MNIYKRHRFPSEIIQHAVPKTFTAFMGQDFWLYHSFNLSHRDIEDLLSERGIQVSYEAIRLWCNKFGPEYAKRLKKKRKGFGDTFYLDEVFVKINGVLHYLWKLTCQFAPSTPKPQPESAPNSPPESHLQSFVTPLLSAGVPVDVV